ncbi:Translation machinery-associated protein 46 [Mycoemilia scoparia]|uniref:Translation machinery-associated protein 46 n=1 Tax=Mycoemilia scoparia TaxID=417184 RepID=A0A9W8A352_9FUNG|nr:Translation machinery-associated protein 46 [Mycoemilia scoparia]
MSKARVKNPDPTEMLERYDSFINEKLQPDLNHVLELRDEVYNQISEYLKLKTYIETIKKNDLQTLKTKIDLGSNFYAKAIVPDTKHIYVSVGFGFHLQMTLEEADRFIDKKQASLEKLADKYTKDANEIRAKIKMVYGALMEVMQLSKEDPKSNRTHLYKFQQMPPKKKGQSSKTEQKAKKKVVEDKTFGLKNKNKSAKVNRYVQQVEAQVMNGGKSKAKKAEEDKKQAVLSKKEAKKKMDEELADLFKPIQTQKVPFGVDPKTVLCAFFKAGLCKKGDKCKFSHNLNVERKGAKIDVYTDNRKGDEESDTMDSWDQSKLEKVVLSKHGNPRTTTSIVCKYFLEAIENGKYGWFWECPNDGNKCKYQHALPPGFVLKKNKKDSETKNEISLEEFLEVERHKLGPNLTPVTFESFNEWKRNRVARKEKEEAEKLKKKEAAIKAGKSSNMSGRDFFDFNPDWNNNQDEGDDDDAFDFTQYRNSEGGYQNDEGEDVANKMRSLEVSNGSVGAQNEALFAAENLDDISDDDDDDDDDNGRK